MDGIPAALSLTLLLLIGMAIAFGFAYAIFGIIPFAIVNGLMALTGKQRRIPMWVLPYMGWGLSIATQTLLSIAGNFKTTLDYDGSIGGWATVSLVELAITMIGVGLAALAFAKQRSRVYAASQTEANAAANPPASAFIREPSGRLRPTAVIRSINPPKRAYIYWILWFIGLFFLNMMIDLSYIVGLGVDIQGPGPGWVALFEW